MKYFKNRSNYFFDLDFINSIIIGTSEKAMINITTISKLFLMIGIVPKKYPASVTPITQIVPPIKLYLIKVP